MIITYQPPCRVVVQIDSSPGVLTCLLRIHVLFGNPLSEIHVITTATPQPASTACTQNITQSQIINCNSLKKENIITLRILSCMPTIGLKHVRCKIIFGVIYCFVFLLLTNFSVLGDITAAVVEVSQTTVPGQSVHDPRCTDGVDERSLSGGCQ